MPQSELPREATQLPLSFVALIDVLNEIEDVPVIVSVSPRAKDDASRGQPMVSVVGEIRPSPHGVREGVHEYWLGDPANLNGSHLRLTEGTFREAVLTTLDGNDYFIVRIALEGLEILLQDENSGAP